MQAGVPAPPDMLKAAAVSDRRGSPSKQYPYRQQQQQQQLLLLNAAPAGGRRTGSPIKNVRSIPASVQAFTASPARSVSQLRRSPSEYARTETPLHASQMPIPATATTTTMMRMPQQVPRYQLPTAASLAKSTSALTVSPGHASTSASASRPVQRTRMQSHLSQSQAAYTTAPSLPLPQQQHKQFPNLHSPKPVPAQTYQTVEQLLRSIGAAATMTPEHHAAAGKENQQETHAREASEYFNAMHGLAWSPAPAPAPVLGSDVSLTHVHASGQYEQAQWYVPSQAITPVTASVPQAQPQQPQSQPMSRMHSSLAGGGGTQTSRSSALLPLTPASAQGERSTPGTGLMDGIVVNGVHYEVQNTEALLEDIRSGKFGAAVPLPVSATPSMPPTPVQPIATAVSEDVFLGSSSAVDWQSQPGTACTSEYGAAHSKQEAAYQPETPTSAFLRLGRASGQQYLLASPGRRNFTSGTPFFLATGMPQTANLLHTGDSLQTMPETPTLYISEFGAGISQKMHEELAWIPPIESQLPELADGSTGSIIVHPDPEEEQEDNGTIIIHGESEVQEEEEENLIVRAHGPDTSFGSAGSGQWATYA